MTLVIGKPGIRLSGGLVVGSGAGVHLAGGAGCAPQFEDAGAVSAGTTFTHPADGVVAYTVTTLNSGGAIAVFVRQQDADDFLNIYIQSTGLIVLEENVAGAGTTRGTAAGVVSSGSRIVVTLEGSTIKIYVDGVVRITYASANNFVTATGGRLFSLGTGGAVSDLKTWTLACKAQEGV